jgi:hypothetical protein
MTKPNVCIHDIETGEVVVREMTDEEYAQHLQDQQIASN